MAPFSNLGRSFAISSAIFLPIARRSKSAPPRRVTRHNLRDLHNLFLVNDNPLGFGQKMVNRRVDGFNLFDAVLNLAIGRDVFHRTGTVERHEGHNILDTGRLHALKRVHHAAGFHLKHGDGFGAGIQLVGRLIIQRDCANIVQSTPLVARIVCCLAH